ncbi:thioredoxin family protein [Gabonibacter chumensis]|uniref:thioredoxin family protein n=1 Tax=Gabonibacter chumensis TaxID=2972474 RepID=UPI0025742278|nr:thioredoxin family protein [Gabonibacter chumensis]MCR9012519.1 thioredoxin family protein [Gabonibacter chumensis]
MKWIKCYLTAVVAFLAASAFGQGIEFIEGGLDAALIKAQKENKAIFVDFMATWCGPCKQLSAEVFPDKKLGDYFNTRFVSCKVDVDKEKELAKKYKITGMPTMVFLDKEGNELKRVMGLIPATRLLRDAKEALGEAPVFEALWEQYKKNKSDLTVQQSILLEAPDFVRGKQGKEAELWKSRVEKLFDSYVKVKDPADLINTEDFRIVTAYNQKIEKNNTVFNLIVKRMEEFKAVIPLEILANYIVTYESSLINELAMKGDLGYKEEIDRVNGDLKPFFDLVKTRKIPVYDVLTSEADALYQIYAKKDPDAYVKIKNAFLERMGEDAGPNEYYGTVMNLMGPTRGKITKNAAEQCIQWLQKLLGYKLGPDNQGQVITTMGDCYLILKDKEKAKECYNQAYLLAIQLKSPQMQAFIKNKLAALDD